MTGRLLAGGGVLLRRVTSWCTSDGFLTGAGRVIGTVLAVLAGGGLLLAAPGLWWPLAAVWLLACWCAPQPTASEDEQPSTDPAEFLRIVHALAEGRKAGVHLAEIAAKLTGDPKATATVRELCETVGIPIASGVRVKGRGVSTGVKVADLPPLPDPSPTATVGVVAAGQASNNNSNNAVAWIVHTPGGPTEFTVEHAPA